MPKDIRHLKSAAAVPAPLPEVLLSELEYGERIAAFFDILFPDRIVESIYKPFYKMLIGKHGIRSACDLACRTGQTLKMMDSLGITNLTGADINPEMIRRCREKIKSRVKYIQSEIALAPEHLASQAYDLILCTKDALPVVLDDEALIQFFKQARKALSVSGVLVIEINNYQKIWRRKERFLPVIDRSAAKKQQLFFFMNDFHEELLVRNLMHLHNEGGHWELTPLSIPVRPLLPAEIEFFLSEAQYSKWGFIGDYRGRPFSSEESPNLIVIAKK